MLGKLRLGDNAFRLITRSAALAGAGAPRRRDHFADHRLDAGVAAPSGSTSSPTQSWNPVTEKFGALAPIYGTIVTSLIAMLIAVPVGLMIAFFLTELCPMWLRRPIGIAIELLAGIPEHHLRHLGPVRLRAVPAAIRAAGPDRRCSAISRCCRRVFAGPPYGIGMLTAGLILAIMVLPFITSISRDVFDAVPPVLKEAAYGLGCTTWEVFRNVVLPYTRVGVIGGVMLGLGRALGETMAVTFVIGNAHKIAASILAPGTTISATIANEFTEAVGDLYTSSLIALGLILFVITFIVLAIARLHADAHREADRIAHG